MTGEVAQKLRQSGSKSACRWLTVADFCNLHNFHEYSHMAHLFPLLVCTEASAYANKISMSNGISLPILCCENTLAEEIQHIIQEYGNGEAVDPIKWINSAYKPTPTIIEVAQALYAGHDVREISYKESDDNDIAVTMNRIDKIIEDSKKHHYKSICCNRPIIPRLAKRRKK